MITSENTGKMLQISVLQKKVSVRISAILIMILVHSVIVVTVVHEIVVVNKPLTFKQK